MSLDRDQLKLDLVAMMDALAKLDPQMNPTEKQQQVADKLATVIHDYVRVADVVGVSVSAKEGRLVQDSNGKLK